jgi:hypothetical protein
MDRRSSDCQSFMGGVLLSLKQNQKQIPHGAFGPLQNNKAVSMDCPYRSAGSAAPPKSFARR